ncbi:hypothetical protein CGRA01v4_07655 [Colletotrichum graminicola]|uniref:Uncharacterized protein n=1 Tax=Colletotrichum graminicola (strain M1.001 / M2 / FGSC 10212) TaxID=645133 RepID=E3QYL1_COLGM|nr:uncharacterized protein GLRG_11093 [Colletotrichum graminicola M1.001]EFQ35949.1 hypothetical protein GLRG_11093 [Colletotrichum graminicola M1.001]WDK16372.1 hypothetical protein CGRA01v4_07655 [Colletotrichum graminicola]
MKFTNTAAILVLSPMVVAAPLSSTEKRKPEASKQYFHLAGDVLDKREPKPKAAKQYFHLAGDVLDKRTEIAK